MKNLLQIFFIALFLLFSISSCSVVKSPESANFQRVKYNSHLKLAKKQKDQKLEEKTIDKSEQHDYAQMRKSTVNSAKLEKSSSIESFRSDFSREVKSQELVASKSDSLIERKKGEFWTPISGIKKNSLEAVRVPEPLALDDSGDWGNLLYILLVVVLILLIISILSDLAGGLIGALIAILLILLILRLLGYI